MLVIEETKEVMGPVAVPPDVLLEDCTLTLLHKIATWRSLSDRHSNNYSLGLSCPKGR